MKIEKIGHCCMRITVGEVVILTDPGCFTDAGDWISGVDAVILTHEHADHCHIPFLKEVLEKNSAVEIYANESTGSLLKSEDMTCELISEGACLDISGVKVETWNTDHADIYSDVESVLNTVLFVEDTLLYPGDAFYVPECIAVDTLALPAEGPWMKTAEAIDYALTIKPRQAFPVHDARLDPKIGDGRYAHYKRVLEKESIDWHDLSAGEILDI